MFDPCIAHHINQQLSLHSEAFLFLGMKKVWKTGVKTEPPSPDFQGTAGLINSS